MPWPMTPDRLHLHESCIPVHPRSTTMHHIQALRVMRQFRSPWTCVGVCQSILTASTLSLSCRAIRMCVADAVCRVTLHVLNSAAIARLETVHCSVQHESCCVLRLRVTLCYNLRATTFVSRCATDIINHSMYVHIAKARFPTWIISNAPTTWRSMRRRAKTCACCSSISTGRVRAWSNMSLSS